MSLTNFFNTLLDALKGREAPGAAPAPPEFWYDGDDLHTRRTVTFEQIAREDEITMSVPNGRPLELKLPSGLRPGQAVRGPLSDLITGAKGYFFVHFDVE